MLPWWLVIVQAILFFSLIIYAFVTIGKAAGSKDSTEMSSAITSVTFVNLTLTLILFGIALVYVTTDTTTERNYLMFMTHAAVFLSILGVSVSSIHQLDSAAVFPVSSQPKKECPT